MTVVDDNVWISIWLGDGPDSHHITTNNLLVIDGAVEVPMAKKAKPEEGVRNPLGEKDPSDPRVDFGESIPYTTHDDVLKDSGVTSKW